MSVLQQPAILSPTPPLLQNHFGLTPTQFEEMKSALLQGNAMTFEKMFIRQRLGSFFNLKVRSFVLGKSAEVLEDITADCIAHWYGKVATMSYQQFTYALLTTIIHHFYMGELKKQSRLTEKEQSYLEQIQQFGEGYEDFSEREFQIQLNQAAQKVSEVLRQLCLDCRRLLQLYLLDEKSERETLEVLNWNISRDALQSRLKQCKLKFQSAFLGVKISQPQRGLLKKYFQ
jgi:DNA-directed RNA polymerase specialized sigma24 family protein